MKILYVIDSLGASGAEHSTAAMMPLLQARGHEMAAATLYDAGFGDEERIRDEGFDGVDRCRRGRFLRSGPRAAIDASDSADPTSCTRRCSTATWWAVSPAGGREARSCPAWSTPRTTPARMTDPNVSRWKLRAVQLLDAVTGRLFVDRFHAVSEGVADANARDLARAAAADLGRAARPVARSAGRVERRASSEVPVRRWELRVRTPVVLAAGRQEHQKAHVDLVARDRTAARPPARREGVHRRSRRQRVVGAARRRWPSTRGRPRRSPCSVIDTTCPTCCVLPTCWRSRRSTRARPVWRWRRWRCAAPWCAPISTACRACWPTA